MKPTKVSSLGALVSPVGCGCASLGSRISGSEGHAALERAFGAGVTWYDVAPSYGDGQAEVILSRFLKGKRDRVQVCTKVGIRPAATPLAMRILKPAVRAIVGAVPSLQKHVKKARPAAAKIPLTAEMVLTSIDESLRRLQTDYVDVLALHGATAAEATHADIIDAVTRIVAAGKARTISIASSVEAGLAGVQASETYGVIQVANNPFAPSLALLQREVPPKRPLLFVTHSAYSAFGPFEILKELLSRNPAAMLALKEAGYSSEIEDAARAFLADYALATNADGITLFSMFRKEHLTFNIARLQRLPDEETIRRLASMISRMTHFHDH